MTITVTDRASKEFNLFLSARKHHSVGIRLGVKTTGCSGLTYVIEFANEVKTDDKPFYCNGVNIVIDCKSLVYLKDTQIDYVKEGLNAGFEFNNPNEKGQCGCGESFTI